MKIIKFETITSTNQYLKENYKKIDNLAVICAEHQTNGRGRLGRSWVDSDDLLFSILIKDDGNNLANITDYSLLIASTIYKVLINYVDCISIKWPNDILYKDKKLVGILLEAVTTDKIECAIIGVGINVNANCYYGELKNKAISLKQILCKETNKVKLLTNICNQFKDDYSSYQKKENDYLKIIRENFYLSEREVEFIYKGNPCKGIVKGISENGNILINVFGDTIEVSSGEISLQNIYNK